MVPFSARELSFMRTALGHINFPLQTPERLTHDELTALNAKLITAFARQMKREELNRVKP